MIVAKLCHSLMESLNGMYWWVMNEIIMRMRHN